MMQTNFQNCTLWLNVFDPNVNIHTTNSAIHHINDVRQMRQLRLFGISYNFVASNSNSRVIICPLRWIGRLFPLFCYAISDHDICVCGQCFRSCVDLICDTFSFQGGCLCVLYVSTFVLKLVYFTYPAYPQCGIHLTHLMHFEVGNTFSSVLNIVVFGTHM